MYQAVITKVRTKPHPNADRLLIGECAGFQVVVGKDTPDGALGVFFPADGQLSEEYAKANDLVSVKDEKGKHIGGGFFGPDRRVRAQAFRGVRSEGYWAPLSSLTKLKPGEVREGDRLNAWQGIPLCERYETEATKRAKEKSAAKSAKELRSFPRHYDTENIRFMPEITEPSQVIITEKIHGTSQRTGLVEEPVPEGFFARAWRKITGKPAPVRYRMVTGSRNVTFEGPSGEAYRNRAAARFEGKLLPGEIVYYEIAGFEDSGRPIMNPQATKKGFGDAYGERMVYSYGCAFGMHDVWVYRMTRHQDGRIREYSWTEIAQRCLEIGVSTTPVLCVGSEARPLRKENVLSLANSLVEGGSCIDARHIREGVCVRIEGANTGRISVWKHKSHTFGVLEGYLKDTGVVDAEEAA